jgi:hypothetical protein
MSQANGEVGGSEGKKARAHLGPFCRGLTTNQLASGALDVSQHQEQDGDGNGDPNQQA